MKKIALALLALSSVSAFASGVGSTTDFQMTAAFAFAGQIDCRDATDNFQKFSCDYGVALAKAGLDEGMVEKILEKLPEYNSVCKTSGALKDLTDTLDANLADITDADDYKKVKHFLPSSDTACDK